MEIYLIKYISNIAIYIIISSTVNKIIYKNILFEKQHDINHVKDNISLWNSLHA